MPVQCEKNVTVNYIFYDSSEKNMLMLIIGA